MARNLSMKDAINEALDLEMRRDPTVIIMGEDIAGGAGGQGEEDAWGGVLGVTKGLIGKYGAKRVMDTPLSESAYIGAAVGAAAIGVERPLERHPLDAVQRRAAAHLLVARGIGAADGVGQRFGAADLEAGRHLFLCDAERILRCAQRLQGRDCGGVIENASHDVYPLVD